MELAFWLVALFSLVVAVLLYFFVFQPSRQLSPSLLNHRVILVTGCDSGLGRELCLKLSQSPFDCRVIATVLDEKKCRSEDNDLLNAAWKMIEMDVSSLQSITLCMQKVQQCLVSCEEPTRLFAVINNAGLMNSLPFEMVSDDQASRLWDVNVSGTVRVTRQSIPFIRGDHLKLNGEEPESSSTLGRGKIINIASVSAALMTPFVCDYAASKSALVRFTESLEFQMQLLWDIDVCLVLPSALKTRMTEDFTSQLSEHNGNPEMNEYLGFDLNRVRSVLKAITQVVSLSSHPASVAVDCVIRALLTPISERRSYYFPTWDAQMVVLFAQYCPTFILDLLILAAFDPAMYKGN